MHSVVDVHFVKNIFIYYISFLNEERERQDCQWLLFFSPLGQTQYKKSIIMKNSPKTILSYASSAFRFIAQSVVLCQMGTLLCQQKMTKQNKVKVQKHVLNTSVSQQRSVLKFAFKQTESPQHHTTHNSKPRKK